MGVLRVRARARNTAPSGTYPNPGRPAAFSVRGIQQRPADIPVEDIDPRAEHSPVPDQAMMLNMLGSEEGLMLQLDDYDITDKDTQDMIEKVVSYLIGCKTFAC